MAEEITALRFQCGGCGKVEIVPLGEEVPLGFHGTVIEHATMGGGWGGEWYACKPSCIRKAVEGACEDDQR